MSEEQHIGSSAESSVGSQQSDKKIDPLEAKQTTSNEQPETSTLKPESENMEVHKHPHHVTEKKKWPEYLLEFLMLFLAVFLGFIAENQREHLVEQKRALQFMSSLYEDLKVDNRQLELLIPQFRRKDLRLDTMLNLLKGVSITAGANGLYKYYYEPANYPDFIYTDRTIQQLKNSGALRLITNKQVSDSISAYDASVKQIGISISEAISEQVHLIRQMNSRLFDLRCCPEIGQFYPYNNIEFPEPGTLLTYDDKVLAEYYNNVLFARRVFKIQRIRLEQLKDQNNRLQQYLNKEYHLE